MNVFNIDGWVVAARSEADARKHIARRGAHPVWVATIVTSSTPGSVDVYRSAAGWPVIAVRVRYEDVGQAAIIMTLAAWWGAPFVFAFDPDLVAALESTEDRDGDALHLDALAHLPGDASGPDPGANKIARCDGSRHARSVSMLTTSSSRGRSINKKKVNHHEEQT